MKRLKSLAVAALSLFIVGGMCIPTYAENAEQEIEYLSNDLEVQALVEDGIDLLGDFRYELIYLISIGLTCKNETAYIYTELGTYDKADLSITAELQQKKSGSWKTIKTFNASSDNSTECYIDKSYPVASGYYYRVVTTNFVDDGNSTEKVTKTGNEEYCY